MTRPIILLQVDRRVCHPFTRLASGLSHLTPAVLASPLWSHFSVSWQHMHSFCSITLLLLLLVHFFFLPGLGPGAGVGSQRMLLRVVPYGIMAKHWHWLKDNQSIGELSTEKYFSTTHTFCHIKFPNPFAMSLPITINHGLIPPHLCIYIHICIYAHVNVHTHTYTYIYIYISWLSIGDNDDNNSSFVVNSSIANESNLCSESVVAHWACVAAVRESGGWKETIFPLLMLLLS